MTSVPSSYRPRPFRAEREFGWLVGGILLAIGLVALWRGRWGSVAPVVAGVGGLLVLAGSLSPRLLVQPRRAWMAMATVLGKVSTFLILLLIYYLVVTPLGVVMRLTGRDALGRRTRGRESYWVPYPARQRDPKHYELMF